MRRTSPRPSVRLIGRSAVFVTLGAWLLFVAAGCGRTREGDFHAYPSNPAVKTPSPDDSAPAGQSIDTNSATGQNNATGSATDQATRDERPVQTAAVADTVTNGTQAKPKTNAAPASGDTPTANANSAEPGAGTTPSSTPPTTVASSDVTPVVTTQKPKRVVPDDTIFRRVPDPNDVAAIAELPPRPVQLLIPEKEFRKEKGVLRVSYDDIDLLKVLNMEPVPFDAASHFPSWLKQLDGQRVRLRGFMYPPYEETGLKHFVLARDNQICCFGRNPKVYDLVDVLMKPGVTTDYIQNRPFDVIGTFHIQPDGDGTRLFELYRIDDATVIER